MKTTGEIIRNRRLLMKMSQKALAKGICSQPMISRIENDQLVFGYEELLHLLNRLNMTFGDLFYQNAHNEVVTLRQRLDDARNNSNYELIEDIIYHERSHDFWHTTIELEAYYHWHCALVIYHRERNYTVALSHLDHAIHLSENNHLMALSLPEIYIARGSICNEQGAGDLTYYKKAEQHYQQLDIKIPKLELKILYNLIRTNCKMKKYEAVFRDCQKAIRRLTEYDSSFLICEIYYFKMLACLNLGKEIRYQELLEGTYFLFKERNCLSLLSNLENYSEENILI